MECLILMTYSVLNLKQPLKMFLDWLLSKINPVTLFKWSKPHFPSSDFLVTRDKRFLSWWHMKVGKISDQCWASCTKLHFAHVCSVGRFYSCENFIHCIDVTSFYRWSNFRTKSSVEWNGMEWNVINYNSIYLKELI